MHKNSFVGCFNGQISRTGNRLNIKQRLYVNVQSSADCSSYQETSIYSTVLHQLLELPAPLAAGLKGPSPPPTCMAPTNRQRSQRRRWDRQLARWCSHIQADQPVSATDNATSYPRRTCCARG